MPRPKSFDPDAVLCKAMSVFWEKGYDAASISDLTAAMGINRFSLYDTFGDKHTLYLKALDSYTTQVISTFLEKVRAIKSLDDLDAFFSGLIEYMHCSEKAPCCMMHKAATSTAGIDEATRQRVEQAREQIHDAFVEMFRGLAEVGEIRSDIDPQDAACLTMTVKSGLSAYAAAPMPIDQARSASKLLIQQLRPITTAAASS